ncbi:hypothetical protein AZI86_02570 [Bdellovibrio bacteriovorus]|uniref:YkuD domain-containing protein n=1 Tax=Bdellovibrio bacteriovorus TaxID=959 RepID=A0A150WNA4_BDEBC|nr:murein L,D-transpeptidase catalytic domain family protein [Bdellovibrio bacteriovorus]KYG65971.1 hypothetical protein AZI86_02570 [Bdellovibrio bacteriovorus]
MQKLLFFAVTLFFISNANSAALFGGGKSINMDDGGESAEMGSGGDCLTVPSHVLKAYETAKSFSESCPAAALSSGKKIVINDYSGQGRETMYIFDQNRKCIDSMYISYGDGSGSTKSESSTSCSTGGSGKTPAGMHITGPHSGKSYNGKNSLKLAGLSGQGSAGRQILIHASKWKLPAGVSQGCTGVPQDKLYKVMGLLGYGSLVYNYFGNEAKARGCGSNAGAEKPPECKPEGYARQIARTANRARLSVDPSEGRDGGGITPGGNSSGPARGSSNRGQRGAN